MGDRIAITAGRGILVPDYLTIDSGPTPAGNTHGVPVAQAETDMVLEASGTQDAGHQLDVRTILGGYGVPGGGGFAWKERTDAGNQYRGWDIPGTASHWESVIYTTTTQTADRPHAVTDPATDDVLLVYENVFASARRVGLRIRDAGTHAWGSESILYTEQVTGTPFLCPCLLVLPSGRILLLHLRHDASTSPTTYQVSVRYSDDSGVSWTDGAPYALRTTLATTSRPKRMRAAYLDGQILLVIHTTENAGTTRERMAQYASDDLGATFTQVEAWDGSSGQRGGVHDILVTDEAFHVVYISTVSNNAVIRSIGSAYDPLSAETEVSLATDTEVAGAVDGNLEFTFGELAGTVLEDGSMWVYYMQPTVTGDPGVVVRSEDEGATWEGVSDSDATAGTVGTWWNGRDAATGPRGFCVVGQRGRVLMPHNWAADPGDEDPSLSVLYLGGSSDLTMQSLDQFQRATRQASYLRTWLPFDLPGDYTDITRAATGAPTDTLANGRLETSTAGLGESLFYDWTLSGVAATEGVMCHVAFERTGGDASVYLRQADASTYDYEVEVRLDGTQIDFRDTNGASSIATLAITGPVEVKVWMRDGAATCWARAYDTDEDREWTRVGTDTSLTDNGATANQSRLRFGHRNSTGSKTARWWLAQWGAGDDIGLVQAHAENTWTNPDDLFPRGYSAQSTYVDGGVSIRAKDGPTVRGDNWQIDAAYDYDNTNLLPRLSPSPRRVYRTTGTSRLVLLRNNDGAGADDHVRSPAIGWFFANLRAKTLRLSARRGGAWTFWDVDCYVAVDFVRLGRTIEPGGGAPATAAFWERNELVGGRVEFDPGGTPKQCRIVANTSGNWVSGSEAKPVILMDDDDCDDTEPASGTAHVWFPSLLFIRYTGSTDDYERYGVQFQGPLPREGEYQAGIGAIGPTVFLGTPWGREKVVARRPNVDVTTAQDGTRRSRVLGPDRRTVQLRFEQVDMSRIMETGAPDYIQPDDSGEAAAAHRATPLDLDGLVEQLSGAHTPVVLLPRVGLGAALQRQHIYLEGRAGGAVYGRIAGPLEQETTLMRADLADEVRRVGRLTLEEEV